jgi:hypothetical protein
MVVAQMALAPSAHALTPAEQQEINSFTLTDSFLQRYSAAIEEANASHLSLAEKETDPDKTRAMLSSLDAMTAQVTKSPAVTALLQRHGLRPREVVLGGLVLLRAQMAEMMLSDPKMAKYATSSKAAASPANMAFYRAHKAQITKLQADMRRAKN